MARTRQATIVLSARDQASPKIRGLGVSLKQVGAIAAAVGAAQLGRQLVRGLSAAVEASAESEAAQVKLATALRNTGQAVGPELARLDALNDLLQKTTAYSSDALAENQALLVSFGAQGETLDKLTRAALDYAAGTGTSLEAAFRNVGRTLGGLTGELGEAIPEIRNLTKEQLAAGEAADVISRVYGGQAAARLGTYRGQIEALQQQFNELQKVVGGPVREVITAFSGEVLTPTITQLADGAKQSDVFRVAVLHSAIALAELGIVLEPVIERLLSFGKTAAVFGITRFTSNVQTATDILRGLGLAGDETDSRMAAFRDRLLELLKTGPSVEQFGAQVAGALDEAGEAAAELGSKVTVVGTELVKLPDAVAQIAEIGATAFGATGQEVERFGLTLDRTLRGVGIDGVVAFSDALVDGAFRGEFAFDKFFRKLIQDIVAATAQAFVLRAVLSATGIGSFFGFNSGGVAGLSGGQILDIGRATFDTGGVVTDGVESFLLRGPTGRDRIPAALTSGEGILDVASTRRVLDGSAAVVPVRALGSRGGARGASGATYNLAVNVGAGADARSIERMLRRDPDVVLRLARRAQRLGRR